MTINYRKVTEMSSEADEQRSEKDRRERLRQLPSMLRMHFMMVVAPSICNANVNNSDVQQQYLAGLHLFGNGLAIPVEQKFRGLIAAWQEDDRRTMTQIFQSILSGNTKTFKPYVDEVGDSETAAKRLVKDAFAFLDQHHPK